MEKKLLTIAITTYNRQKELLNVLRALECQGQFDKYKIIISDNHSDYDIRGWLKSQLSEDFYSIIDIYVRDINIGGDSNIAWIFQMVKTPWMWLTSDDDIPEPNAIDMLLRDIHDNEDLCWIKYSIKGYSPFKDIKCKTIASVLEQIDNKTHDFGEMVFMSNNVYNMSKIYDYIGKLPSNARTSMPHLIAPFFAMSEANCEMKFSPNNIVEFNRGETTYNPIYAYLNVGNIKYIGLFKNKEDLKAYKKIRWIPVHLHVKYILMEPKFVRREFFLKILISQYPVFSLRTFRFILLFEILNVMPQIILNKILHVNKEKIKSHQ